MARPSKKDQRRAEILAAFETCVARYGVEGATLERVAEEAGLARALIRHNVGNRDDVLSAFVETFLNRSTHEVDEMISELPDTKQIDTLIDWLFDPAYSDPKVVVIYEALTTAAANDADLAKKLRKWAREFVAAINALLAKNHPRAKTKDLDAVAAGLTGIYFNVESMTLLGRMSDLREASKAAAIRLVQTLKT
ncbi:MAG: TetR/AcrR family transcriptional regulator [Alphaproteobacteria bacterium]|nr:TetR/AcrR family transcriptional regulator [Alphaproteobacteria bacterium]